MLRKHTIFIDEELYKLGELSVLILFLGKKTTELLV